MTNLKIYCVTNKEINFLNDINYEMGWVGQGISPKNYISCNEKDNIFYKEKYFSELTFHYWFWKNKLKFYDSNSWIGFCQKRRFWMKSSKKISSFTDLKDNIIVKSPAQWKNYDSIICK